MNKQLTMVTVAVIAALMIVAVGFVGATPEAPEAPDTETLDFTLTNLEGEQVALEEYRGKVVLINFWATWCGPCIREIPSLVKLREGYKDQGFEILGLILEPQRAEPKVRKVVTNFEIDYPMLWANNDLAAQFNVSSIPRTLVVDENGVVVEDVVGARPYSFFEALITKHLGSES